MDKISRRRASIEKERKVLGYEPKIGIKKILEWIVENGETMQGSVRF